MTKKLKPYVVPTCEIFHLEQIDESPICTVSWWNTGQGDPDNPVIGGGGGLPDADGSNWDWDPDDTFGAVSWD